MINTETATMDEEDVCESYMMREITKKRKLTPIQLRLLEESFEEEKRLEPDRKLWLAEKLGLQPSQVAVWFQNRRARYKTKQLEHDCDSLKASYAKLKTDWDILFVQNQTLKSKVQFLNRLTSHYFQESVQNFDDTFKQVDLLKEKLKMQENLETQSIERKRLGEEGSSVKSDNTQYSEEEGLENQYSFPELAVLGFYYDPTLTASNLRL